MLKKIAAVAGGVLIGLAIAFARAGAFPFWDPTPALPRRPHLRSKHRRIRRSRCRRRRCPGFMWPPLFSPRSRMPLSRARRSA